MKILPFIFLLVISFLELHADEAAITSNGKKVILLSNGTWRFATAADQVLFKNMNPEINSNVPGGNKPESTPQPTQGIQTTSSLIDIIKSDTSFDLRQVRWGMTQNQVLNAEKTRPISSSNQQIHYELQFLGYSCHMIYHFQNNRLFKTEIKIKQDHVDPARYYQDYEDLKKYLQPLYGNPISDKYEWKNEMYSKDHSKWGFAVSIGFLTCRTTWKNNRSLVILYISGENHQITTALEYTESE